MMPSGGTGRLQRGIGDGIRRHRSEEDAVDGAADDGLRGWRCANLRHGGLIGLNRPIVRIGADPVVAAVRR